MITNTNIKIKELTPEEKLQGTLPDLTLAQNLFDQINDQIGEVGQQVTNTIGRKPVKCAVFAVTINSISNELSVATIDPKLLPYDVTPWEPTEEEFNSIVKKSVTKAKKIK